MAILVRVKAEAQRLLSFFATLSAHEYFTNDPIQLMSDEAFLLESSPAVQTIVHTLRLVLHSDDGVARAYVEATVRRSNTPRCSKNPPMAGRVLPQCAVLRTRGANHRALCTQCTKGASALSLRFLGCCHHLPRREHPRHRHLPKILGREAT